MREIRLSGSGEGAVLSRPYLIKVVGVWREKIASGAKQERAERKKVLALAQARKVDAILVIELTGSARFAARSLTCFKFRFVSSPQILPRTNSGQSLSRFSVPLLPKPLFEQHPKKVINK